MFFSHEREENVHGSEKKGEGKNEKTSGENKNVQYKVNFNR